MTCDPLPMGPPVLLAVDPRRDEDLVVLLEAVLPATPGSLEVPTYAFACACVDGGRSARAGGITLRIAPEAQVRYQGHIGYTIEPPFRGRHFAERACRLIAPVARGHGFDALIITCDPQNLPSRRTCERLGATLLETVPVPADDLCYARGDRWKCRYRWTLPGTGCTRTR